MLNTIKTCKIIFSVCLCVDAIAAKDCIDLLSFLYDFSAVVYCVFFVLLFVVSGANWLPEKCLTQIYHIIIQL